MNWMHLPEIESAFSDLLASVISLHHRGACTYKIAYSRYSACLYDNRLHARMHAILTVAIKGRSVRGRAEKSSIGTQRLSQRPGGLLVQLTPLRRGKRVFNPRRMRLVWLFPQKYLISFVDSMGTWVAKQSVLLGLSVFFDGSRDCAGALIQSAIINSSAPPSEVSGLRR